MCTPLNIAFTYSFIVEQEILRYVPIKYKEILTRIYTYHVKQPLVLHSAQVHELRGFFLHEPDRNRIQQYQCQ